jgi:hypothetical protein
VPALGHREVYLLVPSGNLAAVSLYLSFGFEAVLEDGAEAAQWRRLDDAARGARECARDSRGAEAADTTADESTPPRSPAAGEAASGGERWAAAMCAGRAAALAVSPDLFLTEVRAVRFLASAATCVSPVSRRS